MSRDIDRDLIKRRSTLLARVVLTRRLNVDVHPLSESDNPDLDLICTIRNEKVGGFMPFGVIVWGTATELNSELEANHFAASKRKHIKTTTFLMPVIVLLFSMHKDVAYFSWFVEPGEETNQLVNVTSLDFTVFESKQLDRMIKRITNWYKRMATAIVADAGAVGATAE